ncbi:MAG: suppressor of fused domain protein [Planctomycetes bacterium]|nr:suppressor of fused domain protein [Planctomycetota bacterium]
MPDPERDLRPGGPVVRHGEPQPFQPAAHSRYAAEIEGHIARHVGKPAAVFHELVSDRVHVDVQQVAPAPERPYWTLVTSGMSDLPMTPPAAAAECTHAELVLCLPDYWPLDQESMKHDQTAWPISGLQYLARFPHKFGTWLWAGHTVPNGDPPEPLAPGTGLCCFLLLRPRLVPEGFRELATPDGRRIHFFGLFPLYREEMEYKLRMGSDALEALFEEHGITERIDPKRRNVCGRRAAGLR